MPRPGSSGTDNEAVILELTRMGPLLRVSAMDPRTLTEVVVHGPAPAQAALRRLALAKLAYVLSRPGGR